MTLAILTSELSAVDSTIANLLDQVAEYRRQKRILVNQQKLANKALSATASAKEVLSESAFDGLKSAIANLLGLATTASSAGDRRILPTLEIETVTVEVIETEDLSAELVDRPRVENSSNELFAWQETSSGRDGGN